jgi:hypothetical protein
MIERLDPREAVIGGMGDYLFADDYAAQPSGAVDQAAPAAERPPLDASSALLSAETAPPPAGTADERPEVSAAGEPGCLMRDPSPPAEDDDDLTALGWPEVDDPERWRVGVADEDPDPEAFVWALGDEYPGGDEAEHSAWLAAMPPEVREDYLAGPYTGAGEAIPVGFTHRDPGGPSGVGFAAGGVLDRSAPGPWLARELAEVTVAGHDGLGESELIGVLLGWQRQVAWSQAGLAAAVSALATRRRAQADRPGWSQLGEHVAEELAVSLTMTVRSASRLLDVASGLGRLPDVAGALEAGRIDWPRACIVVDELAVLSDEQAMAVAARLLDRAGEQTTAQLRAAVARAVLAADPAAAERRRKAGRKDTRVEVWHEPSGNAALAGRELAAADAIAADAALTADAGWLRDNGAPGTLAELRAAAYLARLSGRDLADVLPRDDAADPGPDSSAGTGDPGSSGTRNVSDGGNTGDSHPAGPPPASNGRAAEPARIGSPAGTGAGSPAGTGAGRTQPRGSIHLTMPLAAFAGLAEAPGEVAGYGPADAATCRDLATRIGADSATRWCLTVTGPDGRPAGHACAGRRGPDTGQPLIAWVAGLKDKLQLLETSTCRHPRQSPGYAWPTSLRHLIEVRQRTCAAPGCRRPATRCDIDHTVPFDQGGPTCECNGGPLCRKHHRCKQAPGWRLDQPEPGLMSWRLPSGRVYATVGDTY